MRWEGLQIEHGHGIYLALHLLGKRVNIGITAQDPEKDNKRFSPNCYACALRSASHQGEMLIF